MDESPDQIRAGRQGLEERQGLGSQRPSPRISEILERSGVRKHRHRGGGGIAAGSEGSGCLLQSLRRVGRAPRLERRFAEADQRLGTVGVPRWRERERPLEVRKRRACVQPKRPLPGEGEEPQRRHHEVGRLLRLPCRTGKLQCSGIVVSEHIGEVLDPVGGLRLDPACRGDMSRGSGGSRQLPVGDITGEHVPEGIFGLALHG